MTKRRKEEIIQLGFDVGEDGDLILKRVTPKGAKRGEDSNGISSSQPPRRFPGYRHVEGFYENPPGAVGPMDEELAELKAGEQHVILRKILEAASELGLTRKPFVGEEEE